jgi:hypothetical protein
MDAYEEHLAALNPATPEPAVPASAPAVPTA